MSGKPTPEKWSTEFLGPERRQLHAETWPFERIAEALVETFEVIAARIEEYRTPPKGVTAAQAIYRLAVPGDLADLFFNGVDGYRGRFWQSIKAGEAAQRMLLDRLTPKLLKAEPTRSEKAWPMDVAAVRASLDADSAKIWMAERSSAGEDLVRRDAPERIHVPRWAENEAGSQKGALWRWSPAGGDLEVKGALLTPALVEIVPDAKVERSMHLHKWGFS